MGDTPTRFLELFLPAGLEKLFQAIWQDSPTTRPDIASLMKAAAPYQLELVGPMPS
jgi:hypothetical protein